MNKNLVLIGVIAGGIILGAVVLAQIQKAVPALKG